jgi:hypothetical protein
MSPEAKAELLAHVKARIISIANLWPVIEGLELDHPEHQLELFSLIEHGATQQEVIQHFQTGQQLHLKWQKAHRAEQQDQSRLAFYKSLEFQPLMVTTADAALLAVRIILAVPYLRPDTKHGRWYAPHHDSTLARRFVLWQARTTDDPFSTKSDNKFNIFHQYWNIVISCVALRDKLCAGQLSGAAAWEALRESNDKEQFATNCKQSALR